MNASELERWLHHRLAAELGIRPAELDVTEPLTRYGLDSATAMKISGELAEILGQAVDPTLVFDHPDIRSLATSLAAEGREDFQRPNSRLGAPWPREPVAIIGLACRFPGARSPEAFWALMLDGTDPIRPAPQGRWDVGQVAAAAERRGRPIPGALGGFLDDIELFDPLFFGMSPREAARVDPQHRLLLELAWEAFEDAGVAPERIAGTRAGVYVGISSHEYGYRFLDDLADIDARTATGNAISLAANRISYTFDLAGPSTAVDTACSSSLVAVHLACQSLRTGQSSLAVAGGVNLILSPSVSFSLDAAGVLSPTGRCRPFADEADGYVRSEGAGLLVLKRLSDAVSGGDRIYAVILGGAVNHDGRSSGLMAPRGQAQEDLLRAACADAGVEPTSVRFVEAHGTGTLLGDVIEARSIGAVLGGPDRREPCHLGSVKSNVGHLEAAAGVAGLIKAALALWHGILPPTRHVRSSNRHLDFAELGISIAHSPVPLQTTGGQVIGGVSSFGFGGTNAHTLLRGHAPLPQLSRPATEDRRPQVLPLSAMTRDSLKQLVEAVANRLERVGDPVDMAFTAAVRRSHHPWRLAVTGGEGPALAAQLRRAPLPDRPVPREPSTVFVLPGQASRWHVHIPALRDRFSAFRAAFDECADVLSERLGCPLAEFFVLDGHQVADVATAQSALFGLQVALARTWMALGVEPAAVVGHSAGEVAAAHLCGALSLEQAADVIVARGRAIQGAAGAGRMVFAELTADDASALLDQVATGIEVAAVNSERSVVLSGPVTAFEPVLAELTARGTYHRPLEAVNYASHTAAMDGPSSRLGESLAGLKPADAAVPFVSTVTGLQVPGPELGGRYWARNLRERVAFSDAIVGLLDGGHRTFLEIGPQRSLVGSIAEQAGRRQVPVVTVASFARDGVPDAGLLAGTAALYMAGHRIRWEALFPHGGRHVDVPGHPWRRTRCWVAPRLRAAPVPGADPADREALDPLLYEVVWSPSGERADRPDALEPSGSWLVVTAVRDRGGDLAQHVAAELASRGHRAVVVDAEAPGGVGSASPALRSQPSAAWRGILHLGALGVGRVEDDADLQRAQRVTLGVAGEIVAAQREAGSHHRMWFVTRGCQAADGNVAAPTGSMLWGFGRSARAEVPDLVAGLIDLDPGATEAAAAAQLCDAVLRAGQEPEIAIRGGAILVPRLMHKQAAPAALRCSPDATYLVTGGRGALGLHVAGELAARGARHLVLIGRSPLPPRREWNAAGAPVARLWAAVRRIERLGASVSLPDVDVAHGPALDHYLTCFAQEGRPPIRGVVHAAGVARLTPITGDKSAMLDVLRPKVLGGWLLHAALADVPLDFFTCFSSMAVYLPLPLVGPYAAANTFLDALAYHRAGQGLPATSINWGAWAGSRMADSGDHQLMRGTAELEPSEALAAFGALTAAGVTNAAVAHVDWDAFAAAYPTTAHTPIVRHLPSSAVRDSRADGERGVLAELALAAPSARGGVLRTYLVSCLARALGMDPDDITDDRPLHDYGIDSITAVELRNQLEASLGLTVEISALLQAASVTALAEALAADVNKHADEDDMAGLVAFVRDLADEDVERLLGEHAEGEPDR